MINNNKSDYLVEYDNYTFLADEQMVNRIKINKYESDELLLLNHIFGIEDLTILELGGCLGFISVIVNKLLNNPHNHVVLEANPNVMKYLKYNKQINNCSFKLENVMLSNRSDGTFYSYDKLIAGSSHRLDDVERNKTKHIITTTNLSGLEKKYNLTFDFLIMDIEGGELEFLEDFTLVNFKYMLIELHEHLMYSGFNNKCKELIEKSGMVIINRSNNVILCKKINE